MPHLLVALALLAATDAEREPVEFTKDSLEEVKQNVTDEKAVLVDVRSQEEWDEGHLEDSIFLPVSSIRKRKYPAEKIKALPEDKIIYTFCVVGMRAKRAAAALGKQGFDVRALKPGYDELIEAGFKMADDEGTRQRSAR
jgi:phage shock protein E